MREDLLPAPLFALSFHKGSSVAILDPSPRGDSTFQETKLTQAVMTDARFQFGALGAWQWDNSPIEFGFWFPGTINALTWAVHPMPRKGLSAAITRSRKE